MKKYQLLLILLLAISPVFAQDFYVETGKVASNFDYKNSDGTKISIYQPTTTSYLAAGYKNKFFKERLEWNLGALYTGYGAIGSTSNQDYLEWNLNYFEFELNLNIYLFQLKKASYYVKGGVSTGFMLSGTQTINTTVYDLQDMGQFSNGITNFKGGLGVLYPVTNEVSLYLQYIYGKSINVEQGTDETLRIVSNSIGIGININMASEKPKGRRF